MVALRQDVQRELKTFEESHRRGEIAGPQSRCRRQRDRLRDTPNFTLAVHGELLERSGFGEGNVGAEPYLE